MTIVFYRYSSIKSWMQDSDSKKNLGPMMHLAVAAEAGLVFIYVYFYV